MRSTRSLTEAAEAIASLGDVSIVSAVYPMQADSLLGAGIRTALDRGHQVTLYAADLVGRYRFITEDMARCPGFRLVTIGGRLPRRLSGLADHLPGSLWEIDQRLRDGSIAVDVFVGQSAAPDADGFCGFGPAISYADGALARARLVVLEVNDAVPPMAGYRGPHVDQVSLLYHGGRQEIDPWPARAATDDTLAMIGRHVASLIPDGATLQLGVGGVPESFLSELAGKKNLGIHSGAIPEIAVDLLEAGVFTGKNKPVDTGLHVTTSLLGSSRLYSYAAEPGSRIVLRPVSETHALCELAQFDLLYAVNSAIEVDLGGQANAESAGSRRVSSAGGQPDFGRGAHLSPGGANIVALPSRSANGVARIVSRFASGQPVTNHRSDVDYVVTEYGIADLRGRSYFERAARLVEIAHPDDRPALAEVRGFQP